MKTLTLLITLAVASTGLTGCGNKGPLLKPHQVIKKASPPKVRPPRRIRRF